MKLKITSKEFSLAVIFATLGLIVSARFFLLFLNRLNPVLGFLFYYGVVFLVLLTLSKFGLIAAGIKIESALQIIGSILVIFSFFVIFNFTNPYVQYVTTGSFSGASNVYVNNSEDGLIWFIWSSIFGLNHPQLIRILTYSITPLILTSLGVLLAEKKIKIGPN